MSKIFKVLLSLAIIVPVGNSIDLYEMNNEYFQVIDEMSCNKFDIISFSDNKYDANNTIDIFAGNLLNIDNYNNDYYKNFNIDSSNDEFSKRTPNQFITKKRRISDGLKDTHLKLHNDYNNKAKDINIISNSNNEDLHEEEMLLKSNKLNNQISNTKNKDISSKYDDYYLQLSQICTISKSELTNYINQIHSVLKEKTRTNMVCSSIYDIKRKAIDRLPKQFRKKNNITGLNNVEQILKQIGWEIYKSTPEYLDDRKQEIRYRKELKLKHAQS